MGLLRYKAIVFFKLLYGLLFMGVFVCVNYCKCKIRRDFFFGGEREMERINNLNNLN